jgi:regulator of sigma E protease
MLTGLLSMALAFMNILPIPALDGGHAIFLLYEMVSGKPASEKVLEKAQQVGMLILLALMAYTFGNDIFKAFF